MMTFRRKCSAFLSVFLIFSLLLTGCGNSANQTTTPDAVPAEDTGTGQNTGEEEAVAGDQAGDQAGEPTADPAVEEPVKEDYSPEADPLAEKETADGEIVSGPVQTIVGIIVDATVESLAFQTPDGSFYYMTIPSEGVGGNLSMLTVGQLATLSYRGSLDENHAVLTGISNSEMVTGIYVEEYAFAIKIINAVRSMNMKALSDLTNFPVFIDTGNYNGVMNTSGEFEAIELEKIFTQELVERLVNYNLFEMQYTEAGFVMGNGGPNITFDVDDDGILGIIGINSLARTEVPKK